ncbi:MAG: GntR family transcriptional regulator [Verrucomicrobiales bacterium]
MKSAPQSSAPGSNARASGGKAVVVRGLMHGLLRGHWRGGNRIAEIQAAERFDVSRTPVREALLELAGLGVVELRRNCGAVFLPFGPKELRDIYAVRSLLEEEATRLATNRIDPELLVQLHGGLVMLRETQAEDSGWRLDRRLHSVIAAASGNPRLAGEIARYGDLVQSVREVVSDTLRHIHSTSTADHLRILEELQACSPEAAAAAMKAHLAQAADSAVAALEAAGTGTREV